MTLDTTCLSWIRAFFRGDHFYPNEKYGYAKEISSVCSVVIQDVLIYLRSLQTESMNDEGDMELNTCRGYMRKMSHFAKTVLTENDNVDTVVLRFDLIGKTPKAKYCIYEERYDRIEDYDLPEDGSNPFRDDASFPADINSIFKNFKAKKMLYVYMTKYFMYDFKGVPHGKRLILDGGLLDIDKNESMAPIEITCTEDGRTHSKIMSEKWNTKEGETDIGAFEWANKLNKPSVIVSEDGDVLLAALLRHSKGLLPEGPMFIRKRKAICTKSLEGEALRVAAEKKKLRPQTRITKTIFQSEYIDVKALHDHIVSLHPWYGGPSNCSAPIETLCTLAFLTKCDYVQSLPNIGFNTLWRVFTDDVESFADMVQYDREAGVVKISRTTFEYFLFKLLCSRFPRCKKEHDIETLADFLRVYPQVYTPPADGEKKRYYQMPPIERFWGTAANIAFALAYYTSSEFSGISKRCLTKTDDGYTIYGYHLNDEDKPALKGNVTFSSHVKKRRYYSAPLALPPTHP